MPMRFFIWPGAVAAVVAIIVAAVVITSNDDTDPAAMPSPAASATRTTDEVEEAARCGQFRSRRDAPAKLDVQLGPLILVGGRGWGSWKPDAFNGQGYKIPAVLRNGVVATLSVPERMHGRVGLVYTSAANRRVMTEGVRGAETSVRFTACSADEEQGRTGWTGGLVVDRPLCATLVVNFAGRESVRRRLPLGRRC